MCQTPCTKELLACKLKGFCRRVSESASYAWWRGHPYQCVKYVGTPHNGWVAKCAALSQRGECHCGALKSQGRKCHINRNSRQMQKCSQRENEKNLSHTLTGLLFTSSLIYLAQMYFSVFFLMCSHDCVHACVWMLLISLATQLEGTVSHAEHNAEETADWPPLAILLYARMIWIQRHVMVKEARKWCYGRGHCVGKLVAGWSLCAVHQVRVCACVRITVWVCMDAIGSAAYDLAVTGSSTDWRRNNGATRKARDHLAMLQTPVEHVPLLVLVQV